LEGLDQEHTGAATGVKDSDLPLVTTPGQDFVENEVHEKWPRVVFTEPRFGVCALGHELFVNAADEFQRDGVEGILRPEEILSVLHPEIAIHEIGQEIEMVLFDDAFFSGQAGWEKVSVESLIEPPE
jgi:hypothetical protein